jgi:hypothetical protein
MDYCNRLTCDWSDPQVWTTALASTVFQIALQSAKILKLQPTANAKVWKEIEARLPAVALMAPPQGHSWDKNITKCYDGYAGEAVMQPAVADVGYPLMWAGPGQSGEPMDKVQRGTDLDFYWRRTSGFIAGMVWPSVSSESDNRLLWFLWWYCISTG